MTREPGDLPSAVVTREHVGRGAGLTVQGLGPGEWRALSRDEVATLRSLVGL
ncbi:MAG: hypothetical protein ACXU8R_12310 [Xanthobacteraceae bacterium]